MVERRAVAHIYSSFNNTIITVTDITGAETLAKGSGGMLAKADRDESSPYIAMKLALQIAERLKEMGIRMIDIKVRAPGEGAGRTPLSLNRTGRSSSNSCIRKGRSPHRKD